MSRANVCSHARRPVTRFSSLSQLTRAQRLVVLAVISRLVSWLLPDLPAVREAAHRFPCQSNPKQLGLFWDISHSALAAFPAPGAELRSAPGADKSLSLLPYIEQPALAAPLALRPAQLEAIADCPAPLPGVGPAGRQCQMDRQRKHFCSCWELAWHSRPGNVLAVL